MLRDILGTPDAVRFENPSTKMLGTVRVDDVVARVHEVRSQLFWRSLFKVPSARAHPAFVRGSRLASRVVRGRFVRGTLTVCSK